MSASKITQVRVNEQGRIVIPAEFRDAVGIRPGSSVMLEVVGPGEMRMTTAEKALAEAQELVGLLRVKGEPGEDRQAESGAGCSPARVESGHGRSIAAPALDVGLRYHPRDERRTS